MNRIGTPLSPSATRVMLLGGGELGKEVIIALQRYDTGMVTMRSQGQSEFELHARAILGLPVDTRLRAPGASAVIYGGVDAAGIAFENIAAALQVPQSDLRLFDKPESYLKRRMGVALANGTNIVEARERAKLAAARVKPVAIYKSALS